MLKTLIVDLLDVMSAFYYNDKKIDVGIPTKERFYEKIFKCPVPMPVV